MPKETAASKGRLLIVEDDVELCRVLRAFLAGRGYDILMAHRGGEALAICHTEPLDLLLLDIKLPDLDGYEVLRQLRSGRHTRHLPCLILTQKDERSQSYDAFAGHWDRYLTKPFEFARLIRVVDEIIALTRQASKTQMIEEEPTLAEQMDTIWQLTEQIALWQTAPAMAQAFMAVDRRIASKIHDMSKLGALLDLIPPGTMAAGPRTRLGQHLHRCRLAYNQLNTLRYKLRRYYPIEPTPFGNTQLPLPPPDWQQLLDAISRWQDQSSIALSTRLAGDEIHLAVAEQPTHNTSEIFDDLGRGEPQTVYGYLAYKIATRYGGRLEIMDEQLVIIFPGPAAGSGNLVEKVARLEAQLDTLARPVSPPPAAVMALAARLIEPLAQTLLAEIETTLDFLDASSDIDGRVQPWLSIRRNLRFFRLLTFDLCSKQPFHPRPVDLKTLLTSLADLVAHRLIDHRLIVDSDVSRPVLTTDETHLQTLFVLLILKILDGLPENGTLRFHIEAQATGYAVTVRADAEIKPLGLDSIKRYGDRLGCRLAVEAGGTSGVRAVITVDQL